MISKGARWAGICVVLLQAACGDVRTDGVSAARGEVDSEASTAQAVLPSKSLAVLPSKNLAVMQIEAAGHGRLFGAQHQPIQTSLQFVDAMQASVRTAALASLGGQPSAQLQSLLDEADTLLSRQDLANTSKLVLKGGMAWRILQDAPEDVRAELEWRLEAVNAEISRLGQVKVTSLIGDFLKKVGYWDFDLRFGSLRLSYRTICEVNEVPIPPNWAETGTPWVHVGRLTHNILVPDGEADVYTYTDPKKRGACIALPRDGGQLGIICQSATTGRACFWDNILRDSTGRIPWKGATLEIAKLRNGADLSENCTSCHTGNNVFLTSPDDPVWKKLLRDPFTAAHPKNFTLQVEASSDNRGGRPRYVPVTGTARAGWVNTFNSSTTCNTCHEAPNDRLLGMNSPPMPPACGTGCVTR